MSLTVTAPRVNFAHGGRAALVALAAEVSGSSVPDHAIAVALISVSGGFVVMILQLTVSDYLRRHRTIPPKHPDHDEEQDVLNDLLIEKMERQQAEMRRLQKENDRLKRRGQR